MPIPSIFPNITSGGFPEMPDVTGLVDNVQQGIDEVGIPKPPSIASAGTFALSALGAVVSKFGLSNPFASMLPKLPSLPALPAGLPKVPQVPKINTPFKLPF